MSLTTPTTKEISDNIIAQLEASLNQTIPLLPKAFNRVLARALAGIFILLYKYAGFMFLQMFVRTASMDWTVINGRPIRPLVEWGRLIGVGDPIPATAAELTIAITVEAQGGTLPAGSQLLNINSGVTYITAAAVALDGPVVAATVCAVADQAGAIGNLEPGDTISFANPLYGVARIASVVSQVITGADAETVDSYRQRILDRFQKRPQGGAYADYEMWGEEVAGIRNIYPYTGTRPGEVEIYAEATEGVDGYPTSAQLTAVYNSINLDVEGRATRRPAGSLVRVYSIRRTAFDVTVTGLAGADVPGMEAGITSALTEYFLAAEPYIAGLTVPPRRDKIYKMSVAGIVDSVVRAFGGSVDDVDIYRDEMLVATPYMLGIGEKAKLGTVEFL